MTERGSKLSIDNGEYRHPPLLDNIYQSYLDALHALAYIDYSYLKALRRHRPIAKKSKLRPFHIIRDVDSDECRQLNACHGMGFIESHEKS